VSHTLPERISVCTCEGYDLPRKMTEEEYRWASSVLVAYLFGELGLPHRLFIDGNDIGAEHFLREWTPNEEAL